MLRECDSRPVGQRHLAASRLRLHLAEHSLSPRGLLECPSDLDLPFRKIRVFPAETEHLATAKTAEPECDRGCHPGRLGFSCDAKELPRLHRGEGLYFRLLNLGAIKARGRIA